MLYLHFDINFNTILSLTSCQLHDSLLINFIKWNISHLAYQWWVALKNLTILKRYFTNYFKKQILLQFICKSMGKSITKQTLMHNSKLN